MKPSSSLAAPLAFVVLATLTLPGASLAQSKCDKMKLKCIRKATACLLRVNEKAVKKGELLNLRKIQTCLDKFDGGAFPRRGCVAKAEEKQKPGEPDTLCSVTGDVATLLTLTETCVDGATQAVVPGGVPSPAPTPPPPCPDVDPSEDLLACIGAPCPLSQDCVPVVTSAGPRCECAASPGCGLDGCSGGDCASTNCPAGFSCSNLCSTGALPVECVCSEVPGTCLVEGALCGNCGLPGICAMTVEGTLRCHNGIGAVLCASSSTCAGGEACFEGLVDLCLDLCI